jgi:hypothetical protein
VAGTLVPGCLDDVRSISSNTDDRSCFTLRLQVHFSVTHLPFYPKGTPLQTQGRLVTFALIP